MVPLLVLAVLAASPAAYASEDIREMFLRADRHIADGQYGEAIAAYDGILEISPDNARALGLKGTVLEIRGEHAESLKHLFRALQHSPDNAAMLAGIGAGLGNLGEYSEGVKYLARALDEMPDSVIIGNYHSISEKIVSKYPYTPTAKPERDISGLASAPEWLRDPAGWWSEKRLGDVEWDTALSHLIQNGLVRVPPAHEPIRMTPEQARNTAGMWADRQAGNAAFAPVIQHLIQEGRVAAKYDEALLQESRDYEYYLFERYLRDIQQNVSKEKRYIESPNPSQDVIKKFFRDYVKWNFVDQIGTVPSAFPEPAYEVVDGTAVLEYRIFVNEQPTRLPLDHVVTLRDSFEFWEGQDLEAGGQKVKVRFVITNSKADANVWVTWVVRDLGGRLGHAHLGKGVAEVALGDYGCDGTFQLYDIGTVKEIMTHELGHSIGLGHSEDKGSIMYPTYAPSYAYCLLALAR